MGICEHKNHKTKLKNSKELNQISETKIKTDMIKESILQTSLKFEKIGPDLSNISKSICKIKIETILGIILGTGFLLKFKIEQELFYCLITNENVIKKYIIQNNNNIIYIIYDNEFKCAKIKLGSSQRYIKSFTDIHLDITVVEILDEDNISKDYFLFPENETIINNRLINNMIYIPQYMERKELIYINGKIKDISKYEFTYLANKEKGSSGSPIFLENSIKVLGIHKEDNIYKTENYGNFIYPAINIIENEIKKKRNNGKYINGKYIWENGKYYFGEIKNNLPNGKGIKYYLNGNILYEGNFINGKFEGNGKYIWEDNEYYIGQFKNGLFHGKGIEYYSNGKIKYEGDFINGKYEGNGKYIWEDNEYYIGQWKNGLSHGKGIEYYSNGKIKYEGDFINDKYEGKGKFIYENGEYYIGQWKNGLRNGKGIYYYSNGNIL